MNLSSLPPMRVPTLTEVVEWSSLTRVEPEVAQVPDPAHLPVLSETVLLQDWPGVDAASARAQPETAAAPEAEAARIDPAELTRRIVSDVQQQVDRMLEERLRVVLAPMLERLTQTLAQQARDELALALRDVVAEAVSHELARHRNASDRVEPA